MANEMHPSGAAEVPQHFRDAADEIQKPWQVLELESEHTNSSSARVAVVEPAFPATDLEPTSNAGALLPCAGGCGFAVTWHATHCCSACATSGRHGFGCQKVPYTIHDETRKPKNPSIDTPAVVNNSSESWSSRLAFWQRIWMKPEKGAAHHPETSSQSPREELQQHASRDPTETESTHKFQDDCLVGEDCAGQLDLNGEENRTTKQYEPQSAKPMLTKNGESKLESELTVAPPLPRRDSELTPESEPTTESSTFAKESEPKPETDSKAVSTAIMKELEPKAAPLIAYHAEAQAIVAARVAEVTRAADERDWAQEELARARQLFAEAACSQPAKNTADAEIVLDYTVQDNAASATADLHENLVDGAEQAYTADLEEPDKEFEQQPTFTIVVASPEWQWTRDEHVEQEQAQQKISLLHEQGTEAAPMNDSMKELQHFAEATYSALLPVSQGPIQEGEHEFDQQPNVQDAVKISEQQKVVERDNDASFVSRGEADNKENNDSNPKHSLNGNAVFDHATKYRMCPGGCGFAVTWHETHCCVGCARNSKHGPRCRRMRPCVGGCGFAVTWHKTHCCAACACSGKHGPRCQQKRIPQFL